jgi:hypothetical protein
MNRAELRDAVLFRVYIAHSKGINGVVIYRLKNVWHDMSTNDLDDPEGFLLSLRENGANPVVLVKLDSDWDAQIDSQLT